MALALLYGTIISLPQTVIFTNLLGAGSGVDIAMRLVCNSLPTNSLWACSRECLCATTLEKSELPCSPALILILCLMLLGFSCFQIIGVVLCPLRVCQYAKLTVMSMFYKGCKGCLFCQSAKRQKREEGRFPCSSIYHSMHTPLRFL